MGENLISIIMSFIPLSLSFSGYCCCCFFLRSQLKKFQPLAHPVYLGFSLSCRCCSAFPSLLPHRFLSWFNSPPHLHLSQTLSLPETFAITSPHSSLRKVCVLKTPHSSPSTSLTICLCLSTEGKVLVCELLKANAYQSSSLPPQCVH